MLDVGKAGVSVLSVLPDATVTYSKPTPRQGSVLSAVRDCGHTLVDDMQIDAPKVLAKPWTYSRTFTRRRDRNFDVVEASCRQGDFTAETDANGFAVFRPLAREAGGAPVPPRP